MLSSSRPYSPPWPWDASPVRSLRSTLYSSCHTLYSDAGTLCAAQPGLPCRLVADWVRSVGAISRKVKMRRRGRSGYFFPVPSQLWHRSSGSCHVPPCPVGQPLLPVPYLGDSGNTISFPGSFKPRGRSCFHSCYSPGASLSLVEPFNPTHLPL